MASSTEQKFTALLKSERFKSHLFPYLSTSDICAIRATSSANCKLLTKPLFTRIHVTFNANTFTKQSRVNALARIGHHIEHFTFYLPHTEATFLPPLIHPLTGNEISFLYTPHTSMGSVLTRRKYANTELGDILTQQYPPLFHAATNVPSFINAFKALTNMRHLTVRCPGQDPKERYRRSTVDYALISLRISLERAPLDRLSKLSLSQVHPGAFNYLRHVPGFGSVPSAAKRWAQIKKLNISVEGWNFYGNTPGLDHLKIIDDYIRFFAPSLEKVSFTWLGHRGPCPVALGADPLFAPPRAAKKLFHEVTSPMSPLPNTPARPPMHFPKLRYMQIRNATMNAPQLKELITSHRSTVKEFDFENVVLIQNGTWEDALRPLDRDDDWSRSSLTTGSELSFVTNDSSEDLPSPSAAVEAASRELLDVDLGGYPFSDEEPSVLEGMSEEVAAAREASFGITTNLKRRRVRRRRRREDLTAPQEEPRPEEIIVGQLSPSASLRRPNRPYTPAPESTSQVSPSSSLRRPNRTYTPAPESTSHISPSSSFRKLTRTFTPGPELARLKSPPLMPITAPILESDPQPVLLQPTVYDPCARQKAPADEGITSVQRNLEQEETHRRLAEDAAARTSALRKAKEVVLMKLSREFCGGRRAAAANRTAEAVAACRLMAGRDLAAGGCSAEVLEDHHTRGFDSRSILVPLMFARA